MEYGIQFAETGHLVLANPARQQLEPGHRPASSISFPRNAASSCSWTELEHPALISQRLIPRETGSGRIAAMEIMLASP